MVKELTHICLGSTFHEERSQAGYIKGVCVCLCKKKPELREDQRKIAIYSVQRQREAPVLRVRWLAVHLGKQT